MEITHLGHACVLVQSGGARVLIDPGGFAEDFRSVRELDAIVITHQHADHLDRARLPELVRANSQAVVLCDPDSLPILTELGIEASRHPEEGTVVGDTRLEPVGHIHALIHDDIPRVSNVGLLITARSEPNFYHPGDSLEGEPGAVDVLAFPLQAPWQRSRDMTAFLRRIAAPVAFPIHDGLLSPVGRDLYLTQARGLGRRETDVRDLARAGAVPIG